MPSYSQLKISLELSRDLTPRFLMFLFCLSRDRDVKTKEKNDNRQE